MADNYLEKRYEEVFGQGHKSNGAPISRTSVETLLRKNRSYRTYDSSYKVQYRQLEAIVRVNTFIPSAMNRQPLRFKLVTLENGAEKMSAFYRLGGALNLPPEGGEPNAFIIVCSCLTADNYVYIDLGISSQSMLVKAAEMGLNGIMIGSFDKAGVKEAFGLPSEPLLMIAIGKGDEKISLTEISENEDRHYWRSDGVHYVPKLRIEDLIISE